jgi:plasmid maintenance system killer protein
MKFALQIGGLVLASAAAGFAADQKNAAKDPAPRPANIRPVVPRPPAAKNGGMPKQPKMGPPLSNPASPAAQLFRANQDERERALEKVPAKLQEQIRKQLAAFDALPKEQQEIRIHQAERWTALSPERKVEIRQQMQVWQKLPPERRGAINVALRRLQVMPEADRQRILTSPDFKTRFSADEQKLIADLSEVFLPPL